MQQASPIIPLSKPEVSGIQSTISTVIFTALIDVYGEKQPFQPGDIILDHPLEEHGDYSTNVAFRLASALKEKPLVIAERLQKKIKQYSKDKKTFGDISIHNLISEIRVESPGFLNVYLSNEHLQKETIQAADNKHLIPDILSGKKIMVEFAHPNTHKEFHIGHLRNITLGESIIRLLEGVGATLFRANYESDIGMNVAKAIWGVYQKLKTVSSRHAELGSASPPKKTETLKRVQGDNNELSKALHSFTNKMTPSEKAYFLGQAYALGSKTSEENAATKKEIMELNKAIYKDPKKVDLWKETRQWSLDYFDEIYKRLNSHFDRLFFESEAEGRGRQLVIDGVEKGIFIRDSDGSIYFPGEKVGLNNCVFVTREGYATYEGKDVAVEQLEYETFPFDLDIHVVAHEQINFFQISFAALEQLFPHQKGRQYHLAYGMVKLKSGKMSSRTGQVITADWLIDEAKEKIKEIMNQGRPLQGTSLQIASQGSALQELEVTAEKVAVAAVKYSMLRVNPKQDIAFDLNESVSLEGDSGPYLLYTYARCKSVMRKAEGGNRKYEIGSTKHEFNLNQEELSLLRTFYKFPEVVAEAAKNLSPNLLTTYLFDLAQKYNGFYNKHSILGLENQEPRTKNLEPRTNAKEQATAFRLLLTEATANIIKQGLHLLGIETVERM